MNSCKEYTELLEAWLDHSCSKEEEERLLSHLETCEPCRKKARELEALISLLSDMETKGAPPPPDDLHEKIMARVALAKKRTVFPLKRLVPAGVAAAAVALFFLAGGPGYFANLSNGARQMTASPAAAPEMSAYSRAAGGTAPTAPPVPAPAAPAAPAAGTQDSATAEAAPPPASRNIYGGKVGENEGNSAPESSLIMMAPSGKSAAQLQTTGEAKGFLIRLHLGGKLSAAEAAAFLGLPFEEGATALSIEKSLLPRVNELCAEYGLTFEEEVYDSALATGSLEFVQ